MNKSVSVQLLLFNSMSLLHIVSKYHHLKFNKSLFHDWFVGHVLWCRRKCDRVAAMMYRPRLLGLQSLLLNWRLLLLPMSWMLRLRLLRLLRLLQLLWLLLQLLLRRCNRLRWRRDWSGHRARSIAGRPNAGIG